MPLNRDLPATVHASDPPRIEPSRREGPWSSLVLRLTALIAVAILLTSGLTLYTIAERQRNDAARVETDALRLAKIVSLSEAVALTGTRQLLAVLAMMPSVQNMEPAACHTRLAAILSSYPYYTNVGVAAPDGTVVCSGVPLSGTVTVADRPYFREAVRRRQFVAGDYQIGRVTGKAAINFGYPVIAPDGQIRGVAFAAFDLTWLGRVAAQVQLPLGGSLTIVDRHGTIIAFHPTTTGWVGRPLPRFADMIRSGRDGIAESPGIDGTPTLYGFTPLRGVGGDPVGYVVVGTPAAAAFAEVNDTFGRASAALTIIGLLAIAVAWIGSQLSVVRPLRTVVRTAERLAAGHPSDRTGLRPHGGELGQLVSAFDRMAASLDHRDADLRQAQAQYRALVEQSLTGIYLIVAGRFTYVNDAFAAILGYRADELIRHKVPMDIVHRDDRDRAAEQIRRRVTGEVEAVGFSCRVLRKNGTVATIEAFARRLDYGGQPAILGTMLDITDRIEAADRIQAQVRKLEALRAIDVAITSSLDRRLTLDVLLDQAVSRLHVDAGAVLLLDPQTHILSYAAGRGFRRGAIQSTRLRLGEGYAGRAALDRAQVHIADVREDGTHLSGAGEQRGKVVGASWLMKERFVAYHAAPLIAKGRVHGVLEVFHRAPLAASQEWSEFFEALAGQAAIAVDNASLFGDLQRAHSDLTLAYDRTIEGWSRALDIRDHVTEGHTQRVTDLAVRLARAVGMPDEEIVHLRRGALLHDIGKLGVPDSILQKPGPLTDDERAIMGRHPLCAYELLSPIGYLRPALDIPHCHHEKWDGSGYPRGLKGEQIPLAARIFAVADVWDALRSDRPYREAWPEERVREHIRTLAGIHFDPRVVEVFDRLGDECRSPTRKIG